MAEEELGASDALTESIWVPFPETTLDSSQLSITPIPRKSMSSPGLCGHRYTSGTQTCMQENTHTHKSKFYKTTLNKLFLPGHSIGDK